MTRLYGVDAVNGCAKCGKGVCEGMWYCGCVCHRDEWEAHIREERAAMQADLDTVIARIPRCVENYCAADGHNDAECPCHCHDVTFKQAQAAAAEASRAYSF